MVRLPYFQRKIKLQTFLLRFCPISVLTDVIALAMLRLFGHLFAEK